MKHEQLFKNWLAWLKNNPDWVDELLSDVGSLRLNEVKKLTTKIRSENGCHRVGGSLHSSMTESIRF
ncbi:MAG: hypothetical protein F6K14_11615 [Symploca sp. SIO2C1]|nr:hypothetical protein [Symploca sp. SIO2C1]